MSAHTPKFKVKLAASAEELQAAQRLRYRVFVEELGGSGPLVDHDARLEKDQFDPHFDHLILIDSALDAMPVDQVVGVYRVLRDDAAAKIGRFYSEDEYDLRVLKASGRKLLELGRSCLHKEYRGGAAMFHLWNALANYVAEHEIEVLFGVASFHGTDVDALAQPLSLLHNRHLAPADIRTCAQPDVFQPMNLISKDKIDRRAAMLAVPPLIKAYLRLGGFVGEGAYLDHAFNTTDVCLILDTARMNEKNRALYTKERSL
ncbi:GNAT family N-acetyltransferase [Shimia sagamensis]|uniref:L-ornithine N(alpha)-acyltransferase n=1 Tax=Shimia sagamensis TaxID=1566352 RepID=A0ABY1NHL4_9RHOB|nr:GNAT family N-acyltransferase [Shimia sagamensis]SMP09880.1 ornithine-acyl[acyl carrier protein] N-acyltransferase [Shimia sagamensis]